MKVSLEELKILDTAIGLLMSKLLYERLVRTSEDIEELLEACVDIQDKISEANKSILDSGAYYA